MRRLKSSAISNFIGAFVFLICADTQAMVTIDLEAGTNTEKAEKRPFDVKNPLSEWPITKPLTTSKELIWYNRLCWNPEKTLEENKRQLVDLFMKTCCDFSFKLNEKELRGITVGKTENGEDLVFAEKKTYINTIPELGEILIYNEKNPFKGLKIDMATNVFLDLEPLSFTPEMKTNFEKILMELSEDPVGCEMMRVAVSKYNGNTKKLPKITFIPVENKEISLSYTTNCYAWKYLKRNNRTFANGYQKFQDSKFIIFSPEWFISEQTGLFLKKKNFQGVENTVIAPGIIPKEGILLHQIIYALNVGEENEHRETFLISERTNQQNFLGNSRTTGDYILSGIKMNRSLFADDKVYRTMYGFTYQGLDLLNESSYFAHRYKFIRPTYVGADTKLHINCTELDTISSYKIIKSFLEINGDHDLFSYYLSPKSKIKLPEFGTGKYICSDLNLDEEKSPPIN